MNDESQTADENAASVDSPGVITDVENRVSAPAERADAGTDRAEDDSADDTFAAAMGLVPPAPSRPRRLGRRRGPRPPESQGRPLVTAASATVAANFAGAVVPTVQRPPDSEPDAGVGHPALDVPQSTATAATDVPGVGVTAVSALPERVSWLQRRRMRARRVRRTIRHIDPWSVFKISILLYACLYVATMAAGVLLWNAAVGSGIIDRFEGFMQDLGFETWELVGDEIFHGASIIGLVLVAAGSALNVVMAILFNLISDLTGGVRVTVIEEDLGRPSRP